MVAHLEVESDYAHRTACADAIFDLDDGRFIGSHSTVQEIDRSANVELGHE